MRYIVIILWAVTLSSCAQWFVEPYPDLLETEKQLVAGCNFLGLITETADGANPFPQAAETNMALRVRERAGQLGATHLVWLHKTTTMATAETYRCQP